MNAFELAELLKGYSEEELQAMPVRVFCLKDMDGCITADVDSAEVTDHELVIEID